MSARPQGEKEIFHAARQQPTPEARRAYLDAACAGDEGLCRRVEELRVQLGFILESNDKNTVFWIERRGERRSTRGGQHNVFLQATPITVADILRQVLFDNLETVVLTSATLAVAGEFQYIRYRLGIQHARDVCMVHQG